MSSECGTKGVVDPAASQSDEGKIWNSKFSPQDYIDAEESAAAVLGVFLERFKAIF